MKKQRDTIERIDIRLLEAIKDVQEMASRKANIPIGKREASEILGDRYFKMKKIRKGRIYVFDEDW